MDQPDEGPPILLRPDTINSTWDVGTYYKIKYLSKVKSVLKEKGGQQLLDRFIGGCFGHFLDWNPSPKCAMAVHHVVSRQIKSDNNDLCFKLNNTKVYLSRRDYALVTGLQFGDFNYDMSRNHNLDEVEVFRRFSGGQSHVKVSFLVDLFYNFKINDEDGSLHLKIAYIIVLYGLLVGYETDKTVEHWVWALVDDLDKFNRFPWGAYSYNLLCHHAGKIFTSKKQYKFYGPVWALHVWSLEVMPDLGQVVGKCVAEFAHPRCLKWKFRSRPSTNELHPFFEKEEQQILELQPDEFELTTMYYLSTLGFDLGRPGEEDDNQEEEPHPSGSLNDIYRARHEKTPDLLFDAPIETHEVSTLHDTPIGVEDIPWTGTDRRLGVHRPAMVLVEFVLCWLSCLLGVGIVHILLPIEVVTSCLSSFVRNIRKHGHILF
ncbi:uncharacterized protein LOC130987424 isoform X1 [Salvia miltiorrhiza]|uniref:uncharacterized protein LOC130987424 isoform X1 n=1 Tax=Salvia miltiorrhiza TaxID=226208 RepID=UPI0025ABE5F2|nr:uncharacterized protein LOC130987424 isoform X1 [Salvia miltiorrhiza]